MILFLFAHVVDTAVIGWGPEAYDRVTDAYKNPAVHVLELGLVLAVLFHSINGMKITLIDFFPSLAGHIKAVGTHVGGHLPRLGARGHGRSWASRSSTSCERSELMATTIERPAGSGGGAPQQPPRDYTKGRERPVGGFELWMWLFMRISGIVLLVLAVGHTLIMHLPAGGVDRVDFGFVAARWASPFWRTWDWMMLTLALIHGINGLRNITLDYVRKPGIRFASNMVFYVLGFTLFILGTIIIVTFDPSNWPPAA